MGIRIKALHENYIPPMTHELAKGWRQPDRSEIKITDTWAIMTKEAFNKLDTNNKPTLNAVYEGKMWKVLRSGNWWLSWWTYSLDLNKCSNKSRRILIKN